MKGRTVCDFCGSVFGDSTGKVGDVWISRGKRGPDGCYEHTVCPHCMTKVFEMAKAMMRKQEADQVQAD